MTQPQVTVQKLDSNRYSVVSDDGRWVGMPRVLYHNQMTPQQDVVFAAKFAPRAVAQEAADAWNAGLPVPAYRQTADGLERLDWCNAPRPDSGFCRCDLTAEHGTLIPHHCSRCEATWDVRRG